MKYPFSPDVIELNPQLFEKPPKRNSPHPKSEGSDNEIAFMHMWRWLGGAELVREFQFCERRWRFDFVHLESMVAVEIDGRGHNRDNRYYGDIEKGNASAALGWTVFHLTPAMITITELKRIIEFIKEKSK